MNEFLHVQHFILDSYKETDNHNRSLLPSKCWPLFKNQTCAAKEMFSQTCSLSLGANFFHKYKIITHKKVEWNHYWFERFCCIRENILVWLHNSHVPYSNFKLWGKNTVIVPNANGNNCHKYLSQKNVFRHLLFTKSSVSKSNSESMIWTIILMGVWSKNKDCTPFRTSSHCGLFKE